MEMVVLTNVCNHTANNVRIVIKFVGNYMLEIPRAVSELFSGKQPTD